MSGASGPLIRGLEQDSRSPTSGSLGERRLLKQPKRKRAGQPDRRPKGRSTLTSEDVIGKIDLQFLPCDKVMYPGHPPALPFGELLEEVKLHRARGGCLGAKSR